MMKLHYAQYIHCELKEVAKMSLEDLMFFEIFPVTRIKTSWRYARDLGKHQSKHLWMSWTIHRGTCICLSPASNQTPC